MPNQKTPISRLGAPRVQFLERIEKPNVREGQEEIENMKLYRDKMPALHSCAQAWPMVGSVWELSYSKRKYLPMYLLSYTCHMELSSAQIKA